MKSFKESVNILHQAHREKIAAGLDPVAKRMLIGAGIGGVGGAGLGAAAADPGHRGAGALAGGVVGAGLGGLAPYIHAQTPLASRAADEARQQAEQKFRQSLEAMRHDSNVQLQKMREAADAARASEAAKAADAARIQQQQHAQMLKDMEHKNRLEQIRYQEDVRRAP